MGTIADVQALYGSMRSTWTKSQAHVIAHAVLLAVIFGLGRATFPQVAVPRLEPQDIYDNGWFKLAKDTGLVYASFVIPLLVLAAYAAVLRSIGQWLVAASISVWPPPRQDQFRLLNPWVLEPLALTLAKEDFDLGDLQIKSSELMLKYQIQKDERWEGFQRSLTTLTQNALIYLGDFLLFLIIWIAVFWFLPEATWVQANKAHFWRVALILAALAWLAWFRVSRAVAVVPSMSLLFVSTMIRADPEMKAPLAVSEDRREAIIQKLEGIVSGAKQPVEPRPSLAAFLTHRLGLNPADSSGDKNGDYVIFPSLYRRGADFAWDKELHARYDDEWLANYGAYLYYRSCLRISALGKTLCKLTRSVITRAP